MEVLVEDLSHSKVISNDRIDVVIEMLNGNMQEDEISKLKSYLTKYKYKEAYELIKNFIGYFHD